MIRQAAFMGEKKLLKGNLHCHTSRSDGIMSPEDTIRTYAQNGYDFLALTDHQFYNYENFAPETDVLIIPGMEIDCDLTKVAGLCYHHVCIGPAHENGNGFVQNQRMEPYPVSSCAADHQPVLDDMHAHGNMTIYCHPDWSCTPPRSFEDLQGNFAMEIWNSVSAVESGMDMDNGLYWDELLVQGKRIWGVASDDCHYPTHQCRGWVRVNAEKNIDAVLEALRNGAFYSSCGPEIYDFTLEDGMARIRCSEAVSVRFINGKVNTAICRGENLTQAESPLPNNIDYVRACVTDAQGRRAWTNPIFL